MPGSGGWAPGYGTMRGSAEFDTASDAATAVLGYCRRTRYSERVENCHGSTRILPYDAVLGRAYEPLECLARSRAKWLPGHDSLLPHSTSDSVRMAAR
jgi:hypothetical protein